MTESSQIANKFFELFTIEQDQDSLTSFVTQHYRGGSNSKKFVTLLQQLQSMHPHVKIHNMEKKENTFTALCCDKNDKWIKIEITINDDQKISSFGAFPTTPPADGREISEDQMYLEIKEYIKQLGEEQDFSGNVLIAHHDKIIINESYGYRNHEQEIKHDETSRFNVGSMSKMFTATTIGHLVDEKLLDLSQNIGEILTDLQLNEKLAEITIHQLLTHTSGLGSYWDEIKGKEDDFISIKAYQPLLEQATREPVNHGIAYSNLGYQVLAMIIEKVTGKDYYDMIKTVIFDPLKMTHTGYPFFEREDESLSLPYSAKHGISPHVTVGWPNARGSGAGGCVSTTTDLFKFFRGMLGGAILSEETLDLFTTGKINMVPDGSMQYAYGFGVHNIYDFTTIGHNGGAPGINGDGRFFTTGHTVIVLANRDPGMAGQIVKKFAHLVGSLRK